MLTCHRRCCCQTARIPHNFSASLLQRWAVRASSFVACLYTVYVGVRMLVFSVKYYEKIFVYPCQQNSTATSWRTEHTLWGQSIAKVFILPHITAWCWLLWKQFQKPPFFFFCVCVEYSIWVSTGSYMNFNDLGFNELKYVTITIITSIKYLLDLSVTHSDCSKLPALTTWVLFVYI